MTTIDRDEGHAVALAAATTGHSHLPRVEGLLERAISSGFQFTVDDIRSELAPAENAWLDGHGNALGGLIASAARDHRITPIGWTTSRRPARRGAPIRIWKGNHQ